MKSNERKLEFMSNFYPKWQRANVFTVIIIVVLSLFLLDCPQPTSNVTTVNNVSIVWKGASAVAPNNPSIGWAYCNTIEKKIICGAPLPDE